MPRDEFDDDWTDGGGFEDPRFAGGRHPDDAGGEVDAFGRPRRGRSWCGCLLILLAGGAVASVVCCGGLAWVGTEGKAARVADALAADPAAREGLEAALGEGYELRPDIFATLEAPSGIVVFEAAGDRGAGTLRVRARRPEEPDGGPNGGPADGPGYEIPFAVLTLEDGRRVELVNEFLEEPVGERPVGEEAGGESVPEVERALRDAGFPFELPPGDDVFDLPRSPADDVPVPDAGAAPDAD